MDFLGILKTAGSALLSEIPGGSAVMSLVNEFLPDDEKLPADATGAQAMAKYEALPPDAQVKIHEAAAKVEVSRLENQAETYQVLSKADGQSTRPKIALIMVICFAIQFNVVGAALAYAVYAEKTKSLAELWPFIVAFFGMPMTVIRAYFGILAKEQGQRLGVESKGLLGAAAGLLGKWKG